MAVLGQLSTFTGLVYGVLSVGMSARVLPYLTYLAWFSHFLQANNLLIPPDLAMTEFFHILTYFSMYNLKT
jgi:hypothetical protein